MFFSKNKIKKKLGVTLIEVLMVMTLSSVFIVGMLEFFNTQAKQQVVSKIGNDLSKIMYAVMRRLSHDGAEYADWETTYVASANKPSGYLLSSYMNWQGNDEVVNGFLGDFLVSSGHTQCPGAWNPYNDAGGPDLGAVTNTETTALVPCSLWDAGVPLGLDIDILITKNTLESFDDIAIYLNFMSSSIFNDPRSNSGNGTSFVQIRKFSKAIEDSFKKELLGSQYIQYVSKGADIFNPQDDVEFSTVECFAEIQAGRTCLMRYRLDTTDATNDKYLKTDGTNNMNNSISFSSGATGIQQCAHWTGTAGSWVSELVDCGIIGGEDSTSLVEAVSDVTSSKNFQIAITLADGTATANKMCKFFTEDANGYLIDPLVQDTPCGIITTGVDAGSIVQLLTDDAYIGRVYSNELITQNISTNGISIRKSATHVGNLLEITTETGIKMFNVSETGQLFIGEALNYVPTFDVYAEDTTFYGDVEFARDFVSSQSAFFELDQDGELVQFKFGTFGTRGDITLANTYVQDARGRTHSTDGTIDSSGTQKQFLGLSSANLTDGFIINSDSDLMIQADNGHVSLHGNYVNINAKERVFIEADTFLTGTSSIYTETSSFRPDVTYENMTGTKAKDEIDMNKIAQFELATVDHVNHALNMSSKIKTVGTIIVDSNVTSVNKPHCLDFVLDGGSTPSNPYYKSDANDIYSRTLNEDWGYKGSDLSRIVLVPIWFKTYNSGFSSQQMYAQHALSDNTNPSDPKWFVYQYLQGEGSSGNGAREDGVGSSIAILYCDYTAIPF